jgi:hypothetical protein
MVHHLEPVINRPDLLCTEYNCAPVCVDCHARIEQMVREGKDTKGLFNKQGDEAEYENKLFREHIVNAQITA